MNQESQWVRKRRGMVDAVVNGESIEQLAQKHDLRDVLMACKDEIRTLREHLTPTRSEGQ